MSMAKSRDKAMDGPMLEAVAGQFRALSEPARLALLQELLRGEASVNDLTAASGFSQANTSRHLSVLHGAGFLVRRKQGTTVFYRIADPVVKQLCDIMCARVAPPASPRTGPADRAAGARAR
jgi:DNA-binding transcriptional ArsR family regulator